MVKIKVCGVSRICDIDTANEYKPDYIGFVFAENSRRSITPQQALELRRCLRADIIPVGVFVNEEIENIVALTQSGVIDIIQLHGSEDESYIQKLKTLTGKTIIKAVAVINEGDAQKWADTAADYLLLDNKNSGSGEVFDWSIIGHIDKPYFLAGGLSSKNITEAIKKTSPFAVDVSSGVETDGLKDSAKIKEFIGRCQNRQYF